MFEAAGSVAAGGILSATVEAPQSEALECVQLAAAFAGASLLALLADASACWRLVRTTRIPT